MPTLVLATGFEHGVNNTTSLVKGNVGNKYADLLNLTPSITSSTPRTGGFCLQISPTAATHYIRWTADTLGAGASVMVVGFGLYFPSAIPTADSVLHYIVTSSASIDLALSFRNSDDKLIINTSTGSGTAAVSANAVAADTWYWIDLRFTISGTSWTVDWAIDTTAQTQFTHTAPTTDTNHSVALGSITTSTYTARYDDLVVSKTSGDYPLGKHMVKLLTADTGGTTAEIGTANATSRFVTNSTADATHNSAQILTALTDGPPPTFGATASGVAQRTAGSTNAVGIPMTTYTLGTGESFSGLRIEIPGWAASATANRLGFRTYNGTTETILQAGTVDPNFDADTAAPAWFCKMATAGEFDTQTEVDALVVRVGYSDADVNPVPGAHAIYGELAVKEATSTPIALDDTAAADDALTLVKVHDFQAPKLPFPPFKAPAMYPEATPFQLLGDREAVAVATPVSLTDTATADDALASAAAVQLADTATATDALTLTVAVPLADTASALDAATVTAAIPLADTASADDVATGGVAIPLADTAAATDALSITVALALADTATAVDALGADRPVSLADTATATDALLLPPQLLSGLALWFRADDLSGLSDGAGVSSWTSLAGTSVASQATGGFQPTKQTVSGETVVRFDGTDDRLLLSGDALTALQNASSAIVFLRVKSSASGIYLAFSNGLSSGSARLLLRRLSGLYNFGGRRLDADSIQSIGYQAATASVEVATGIVDWSTANIDVFVEGVPRGSSSAFQTAGSTSNTASVAAAIGSAGSEDTFATADIYEIVVAVGTLPTGALRRTVEQYLGVSSLVVGLDDDALATEAMSITVTTSMADTATASENLSLPQNEPSAYQAPQQIPGMFFDPESASMQLQGSREPSSLFSVSLSDTAAASDSLATSATFALVETATASDSLSTTAAVPLADTALGTEGLTAGVSISFTETATATDALSIAVTLSFTDTASAADALAPVAAITLADTAVATEGLTAGVPISFTETATATDALSIAVTLPLTDTASAADALAPAAAITLADTAVAAEALTAGVPISFTETAAGADSLAITSTGSIAETATATDSLAISVTLTLADVAAASDLVLATRELTIPETAAALDALSVAASQPLAETAVAADSLAVSAPATLADLAAAADLLSIEVTVLFEGTLLGGTLNGPGSTGGVSTGYIVGGSRNGNLTGGGR